MSDDEQGITVDTSDYPIVVLTYHQITNDSWLRTMNAVSDVIRRGEPCGFVLDTTRLTAMPNAEQRKKAGEWTKENRRATNVKAWALVISNPIVRGAVTAINWLAGTTSWPQKTFGSLEEAKRWARAQLR